MQLRNQYTALYVIIMHMGFQIEAYQGSGLFTGDDTGLNNIALLCRNTETTFQDVILAPVSGWGTWREIFRCPENRFFSSFRLQAEEEEVN